MSGAGGLHSVLDGGGVRVQGGGVWRNTTAVSS